MKMWATLGYDGERGKVSFVILTFDKLKEKEGMEGMGVQMKVKKVLIWKMEIRLFLGLHTIYSDELITEQNVTEYNLIYKRYGQEWPKWPRFV